MTAPTLLLAYGNPDREDDGAAWHVLAEVAQQLGCEFPASPEDEIPTSLTCQPDGSHIDWYFGLQLLPEMAEMLSEYRYVCFIDAHTGSVSEPIHWQEIPAQYQNSPLSHHVTPATCLALASALYRHQPEAALLSVRGHQFGFERALSPNTAALILPAAEKILTWLRARCSD